MNAQEIELRRSAADDYKAAKVLVTGAETAVRSMTDDEVKAYDQHIADGDAKRTRAERMADIATRDSEFVAPDPVLPTAVLQVSEPAPEAARNMHDVADEFVRSDAFKSFAANGMRGSASLPLDGMSMRAVLDNTVTSAGAFQNPLRVPNSQLVVPNRALRLLDLLPHGTTSDNSVEYVQATTSSVAGDTAVEVAESGAKPETTETFLVVTDPVRTIAAFINMTRQAAEDNDQLNSYIESQLVYRIQRRPDNQVINGDGTGANLLGLLNRAGILTLAPATAEDRAITARKAVTLLEQNEQEANAIVLNPADLEKFDLYAATTKEFIKGDGYGREVGTLWGLRPVTSNAITVGTALVMDTAAAMVWDRHQPVLFLTDSHASNFTANILTLLAELRAAISLFQPKGVCRVTFNGAI